MNYPNPLVMPDLRVAIQDYLREIGIDAPRSCILVVSGALQALQLICMGIVQAKSTVYVASPSYLRSLNSVQSVGVEINGVPMDADGILPWMIRGSQSNISHSLLYTITTFQNPTGCVMSESRREEVLTCCRKNICRSLKTMCSGICGWIRYRLRPSEPWAEMEMWSISGAYPNAFHRGCALGGW